MLEFVTTHNIAAAKMHSYILKIKVHFRPLARFADGILLKGLQPGSIYEIKSSTDSKNGCASQLS